MTHFRFFPQLSEEIQVHVASFLDFKDGTHLLMTSQGNHRLIATNPRCWEGWKPIITVHHWEGANNEDTFVDEYVRDRHRLSDAAFQYDWGTVGSILSTRPEWVNLPRVGGTSGYSPLHQAAHGNAPLWVVRSMVYGLGAWRTLRTTDGMRAVDIAQSREGNCHPALLAMLQPPPPQDMGSQDVALLTGVLQDRVHTLMNQRSGHLIRETRYRLPQLAVLAETTGKLWCAIPGMYGGFSLKLHITGNGPKIVSESWCRVAGGSGQRHEITAQACRLVDEGFV